MKEWLKECAIVYGICIGIPLFLFLTTVPIFQFVLIGASILFSIFVIKESRKLFC